MKRTTFITLLLIASSMAVTGCEKNKEKNCDNYNPWPSPEAQCSWTDYSPGLVNDWNSYNDVPATLAFWGSRFRAYDSILVRHKQDTVMLCGYLKTREGYKDAGLYFLLPHPSENISMTNHLQLNLYTLSQTQEIDTLQKVYLLAKPRVELMEDYLAIYPNDSWARSSCSLFEYTFYGIEIIKHE